MLAMSFLRSLFNCMSEHNVENNGSNGGNGGGRTAKVKFGVPLNEAFKNGHLPAPLKELLVHIAREGVSVTDLFRRPGNPGDMKRIMKRLSEGRVIQWTEFNFYTLANVAKRFLLQVPGGALGSEAEFDLLNAMDINDDQQRVENMHLVISRLSTPVRHLLALLFGTWFRMIYHTDVNAMSVEAVAKSVAGSIFHTCNDDPRKVDRASKVMEVLITGFASAELFGHEIIEYFTTTTMTSISRLEKFKYEFVYPVDVPHEESMRRFVAMLMEEASKHRFNIVEHAVSEDVFNSTTVATGATDSSPGELTGAVGGVSKGVGQVTQVESAFVETPARRSIRYRHSEDLGNSGRSPVDYLEASHSSSHARTPSKRFNSVKRRQLERLAKRSDWFLSPPSGCGGDSLMRLTPLVLATSGPDLLETTGEDKLPRPDRDDIDSEEEIWGAPNSEPAIRRRTGDNSRTSGVPVGGACTSEDSDTTEQTEIRYFVVERFYGPQGSITTPLGQNQ